jgi:hypothetical protein
MHGPLTHMSTPCVAVLAPNSTSVKGPRVSTSDTWVSAVTPRDGAPGGGCAAALSQAAQRSTRDRVRGDVGAGVQVANALAVPGPASIPTWQIK